MLLLNYTDKITIRFNNLYFLIFLVPMDGKNTSDIIIPSVFVAENTGIALKDYYGYSNG